MKETLNMAICKVCNKNECPSHICSACIEKVLKTSSVRANSECIIKAYEMFNALPADIKEFVTKEVQKDSENIIKDIKKLLKESQN